MVNEVVRGRECAKYSAQQEKELLSSRKLIIKQDSANASLEKQLKVSISTIKTVSEQLSNQKDLTALAEKETKNVKLERWFERGLAVVVILILL